MLIVSGCGSTQVIQSECLWVETIRPSATARNPAVLVEIVKSILEKALLARAQGSSPDLSAMNALIVLGSEEFTIAAKLAIEKAALGDIDVISNQLVDQILRHNELVERECS